MTMNTLYSLVTGPVAWAAFALFFGGLIGKFVHMVYLAKKKDPVIVNYLNVKYGLRSILAWSIPFVPRNSRLNPVMTVVTYCFHVSLLLSPIFLMAHVMLWKEGFFGISWLTLPDSVADVMTVIVVAGCVFFAVRRIIKPEVAYVTDWKDYALLFLVSLPFITGFLAYHQIFDYKVMIILHILSGEVWLAVIPFTWLSHMMFAPMVRAYVGSEFGAVRHVKDW